MHFALTEEQTAIQETALTFAKERIAPHAAEWDEKSHFPVDVIRETAALGMAAIYVPAEQGGSGLTRKFQEQIVTPFAALAEKYPFAPAGPDLSPYEFNEFFRAGGTFWTFYDAELKSLVTPDGSPAGGQSGAALSPEIGRFLRMAYDIRTAFYGTNPEAASLKFTVRTSGQRIERPAGVNVRWVSFDVGGGLATYMMGPPVPQDLVWPGPDAALGASLRVLIAGGTEAQNLNLPGAWGVFHLVDQAQVTRMAPNTVQAVWRLPAAGGVIVVPYEIASESPTSPFAPGFFKY